MPTEEIAGLVLKCFLRPCCQQERFLLWEENLAKSWQMSNSTHRECSIFCCAFTYPCLLICREFLKCVSHCRPSVHSGFYHWLYIVIEHQFMRMVWFVSKICSVELGKMVLPLPRLLSSFPCLSTLKYFNSAILLNITRVKFSRMTIDLWNLWKFSPSKNMLYSVLSNYLYAYLDDY